MSRENRVFVTNASKGKGSILLGVVGIIIGLLMGASGNGAGWLIIIISIVLMLIGKLSHWFSN